MTSSLKGENLAGNDSAYRCSLFDFVSVVPGSNGDKTTVLLDDGFLRSTEEKKWHKIYRTSRNKFCHGGIRLFVSPSSLQTFMIDLNTLTEKSTFMSLYCRSGIWTRNVLCIGVKWRIASACTPHWSKVDRVRNSHMFLSGHHNAWSDQSLAMSGK